MLFLIIIFLLSFFCGCARRDFPENPELITITSPTNGDTIYGYPIDFMWTEYPSAVKYRIIVFSDLSFDTFEVVNSLNLQVSAGFSEGMYRCFVDASTDGVNFVARSDTIGFFFTYRVQLSWPPHNSVLNSSRILLDWNGIPEANGYRILLWRNDTLIFDRIEWTSSVTTAVPLVDGRYRWCVGARISTGEFSFYSDTFSFSIHQEPFRIAGWAYTYGCARDVFALGNWLFIADGEAGIGVANIENPDNPRLVYSFDWGAQDDARSLFADSISQLLVIADYRGVPPQAFFSIENPASPSPITISGIWNRRSEQVLLSRIRDTLFLLVADHDDGFVIYDLATPGYANSRGSALVPYGYCMGIDISDTLVAVAASNAGVSIVNIANPNDKVIIGRCYTYGEVNKVLWYGNAIYVADDISGLTVIDVSDPTSPIVVYHSDTQVGSAQDLAISFLSGNPYLALSIGSEGTLFYDISNPFSPLLVGCLETPYSYGVCSTTFGFVIADRDWGILAVVSQ